MASQKLLDSLSDINAIADSMDQLVKLAGYLTGGTNWSAQQLVTAYLSYGMMHGWNIAQTMEKMNVIKGKITYQAATMFGIVIASSKCKSWKVITNSDVECSLEFVRADNNQKYTVQFTIEMAQRQGLTNNRQWQTMPKQMLMAKFAWRQAELQVNKLKSIAQTVKQPAQSSVKWLCVRHVKVLT